MKTHLDLFSGIGGFAIAAQWAGFTTVGFCEIEPYAQQVLIEKFGAYPDAESLRKLQQERRKQDFWRWISNVGGEECTQPKHCLKRDGRPMLHSNIFSLDGAQYRGVTLITGGVPCQPASCAGKRRGKEDDRWLWPETLRVIDEARPAYVLLENVPGLLSLVEFDCPLKVDSDGGAIGEIGDVVHRKGRFVFNWEILEPLVKIGYAVQPLVVPACAVDARHRRDRVWIIGTGYDADTKKHAQSWCGTAWTGRNGLENCNKDVANTQSQQDHRTGQSGLQPIASQCGSVANPKRDDNGGTNGIGRGKREQEQTEGDGVREDGNGSVISRLGGMVDGLPEGMDGCCLWPEEDPQVPRVSQGVKNRTHRLRALGNAIVPQVAYQILKALPL